MTVRYFAIGDIHGRVETLKNLLVKVDAAAKEVENSQIVFLGDYVDRGRQSFEVIELLSKRMEKGDKFLCGNHDEELRRACRHYLPFNYYESCNDAATRLSYEIHGYDIVGDIHGIPQNHIDFFAQLYSYYDTEEAFFVHAGVDPYNPDLYGQGDNTYLWIRAPFLNHVGPFAKTIVHGHSITKSGKVEFDGRKISVDTGVIKNDKLSCAVIENGKLIDVLFAKQSLDPFNFGEL